MKATGIVRSVDQLGRVVIPKELRTRLNMNETDPVEIFVEDNRVILQRFSPGCIFCGNYYNLTEVNNKNICDKCKDELN